MIDSVKELEPTARVDPQVCRAYNSLCDALDALNKKLEQETSGPLKKEWEKKIIPRSVQF
jgi:hypothetical protein